MSKDQSTREIILEASKKEFLAKGFKNASLRNIAASIGLTTGAIFGYFSNKNAIFEALVNPMLEKLEIFFEEMSNSYYDNDGDADELSIDNSIGEINKIYDFIYDNFDEFRLLVCCSEGSSREDFVHTFVETEVAETIKYMNNLRETKGLELEIEERTLHTLSDSYINSMLEPVRHNMSKEEAKKDVEFLGIFYTGGWKAAFEAFTKK